MHPPITVFKHCIGIVLVLVTPLLAVGFSFLPMESSKEVDLPFDVKQETKKILAFGGFPSCNTTCPLSLAMLGETYKEYKELSSDNDLQVFFLNIELDTRPEISVAYAKSFHPEFNAYSIQSHESEYLFKALALDTYVANENINTHSNYIYFFEKDANSWRVKRIFNSNTQQNNLLDFLLSHTA